VILCVVTELHQTNLFIIVFMCCFYCSVIRNFEGSLVIKYQHPDAVYGCDWSPHNAYVSHVPTDLFTSVLCTYLSTAFSSLTLMIWWSWNNSARSGPVRQQPKAVVCLLTHTHVHRHCNKKCGFSTIQLRTIDCRPRCLIVCKCVVIFEVKQKLN